MSGFILIGLTTFLSKLKVSKRKISVISSIFLVIFMFITGFTASVTRACIMGILGIIASLLHKNSNILNNLCIALLIALINNPYNITSMSVLLSYGGVVGIIFFLKPIQEILDKIIKKNGKINKYIKGIIAVSLSVQIVIMPIMMYNYKTISLTFIIANILTSLLISIIIILGFAIIIISLIFFKISQVIGIPYKFLINLLLWITEVTSKVPFSKIYVKMPYTYQIIFYYIFISILRLSNNKRETLYNFKIQKTNYINNFNHNFTSNRFR